ncbi:MAG: TonB-dependent receptor [Proteobacteria bacterium]|nr:TonB-dependent receptor [Pseudomonadota bacterium]
MLSVYAFLDCVGQPSFFHASSWSCSLVLAPTPKRAPTRRLLRIRKIAPGVVIGTACQVAAAQQAAAPPDAGASAPTTQLQPVLVRGKRPIDISPLPGLSLTPDQIPANLQSATARDIKDAKSLNIGDYMNAQMQGVSANDYAGNPFQMDVNYRGFTASPQVGTPQGLSVFFDGVRVNEPFGDVVNWDLIPLAAIERFDLFPGSNPLFGLNTLGGALSLRTKSGYTAPGLEASVLAGSWGRTQVTLSGGAHDDTLAGFAALNVFDERGWRDDSPSRVRQFFGRGDLVLPKGSITASLLAADNTLVGNGLIPIELYDQRPETVFTSPDRSVNRLWQLSLSGELDVSDRINIVGRVYHRQSDRDGLNGDIYEGFDDFQASKDFIEDPTAPGGVRTRNGANQSSLVDGQANGTGVVDGTPIGLLTTTSLQQKTDGIALQANWNLDRHKFMVGASVDRSRATYTMVQQLGLIDAAHQVYLAPDEIDPQYYAASHQIPGNDFSGTETTISLFASETWTAASNLFVTAAARYNYTTTDSHLAVRTSAANVELHELITGTQGLDDNVDLTTQTAEGFRYTSFNPSLGINWLPQPDLDLYGNLSRGARVPSVVELGCAFDSTPVPLIVGSGAEQHSIGTAPRSLVGPGCNLPTTLSGDPYLPQIRSTSGEIGARGRLLDRWNWSASLYRTDLTNDIYFVGVGDNRSYFDTIGKTRRQGLELGIDGSVGPFDLKLGYSYTDATFESTFYTVSPHNSSADFNQNSQAAANNPELAGQGTLPTAGATANQGRGTYQMIRIDPGARMPGIPQHAFNGKVTWHATPALQFGLAMLARSDSFVRGNENNLHQPAGTDQQTGLYYCGQCAGGFLQLPVRPGRPFTDSGRVPGYAIFNLDTTYRVTQRLSVGLQITNLLDRKYFTAGRLGVNPFSPSVHGAIGPSGWNYNSAEWQNTTYVGPGSPRGFFVSVNYELDGR